MLHEIAPKKLDISYIPQTEPSADSIVFCFRDMEVIACPDPEIPEKTFPTAKELDYPSDASYLFSIGDVKYFLLTEVPKRMPEGYGYINVRLLRRSNCADKDKKRLNIFALVTALHLYKWYSSSRFCGECGGKTVKCTTERAMLCTQCGALIYPRINPAVIVGIVNGDRLLITRYVPGRRVSNDALVAGYIEIGETPEDTVHREVMEEVGLRVKNIRYFGSQPWGFSAGLLIGYFCEVDGDAEITLDPSELSVGEWVKREDIRGQSDDYSLTNEMMMHFKNHPEEFGKR